MHELCVMMLIKQKKRRGLFNVLKQNKIGFLQQFNKWRSFWGRGCASRLQRLVGMLCSKVLMLGWRRRSSTALSHARRPLRIRQGLRSTHQTLLAHESRTRTELAESFPTPSCEGRVSRSAMPRQARRSSQSVAARLGARPGSSARTHRP